MFSGSLVAIVTPMRPEGAVDFEAWRRLIELHLASGTSGIVVGGTTGESATLSDAELWELTERACAQVRRKIQIIAGAGTSSTAATVERARRLSELPIDGLLVVTPAYNRPTQEGLYQHFAAVARATRAPVILYNVPSRTAVDMLPATVQRLAQLPGIVGVKEAVADLERVQELVALCPGEFDILSGDDLTARRSILAGAKGLISVTANVAPRAVSDMVAAAMRGDADAAERLDAPIIALHRDLFIEANPIPAKWALARMGIIQSGIRLPLTELSPAYQPAVLAALSTAGVLN
ncbi:MAG TPA: 4-hydroxy-tetrahydrodipicolinate synthase [Steroidobacteraceae bacterium]|nr:4-hydroxy-tetrahydrodipicolinate synthase [Steroidobacteraceae bacterium]